MKLLIQDKIMIKFPIHLPFQFFSRQNFFTGIFRNASDTVQNIYGTCCTL